ncbi:MAG: DUF3108 domain-containing protein, partial [Nitrospinae bacterium]|nr:DUF3108 domain-containing protein [Nitrospinota bacterium]
MSRILLSFLMAMIASTSSAGAAPPLPFAPGERFVYDISWSHFLTAGEGVLAVTGQTADATGAPLYQLEITGRTVGFVGSLYPVLDVTRSLFDVKRRRDLSCVITISENDYRKVKSIRFDRERNVAVYKVDNDPEEEFEVGPDTQGPVSALYVIRAMRDQMKPGAKVSVSLFDDRERYELEVQILRRETLDLPFGMTPTIVAQADLKTEGVFRRKGKMTVWFSDDAV